MDKRVSWWLVAGALSREGLDWRAKKCRQNETHAGSGGQKVSGKEGNRRYGVNRQI